MLVARNMFFKRILNKWRRSKKKVTLLSLMLRKQNRKDFKDYFLKRNRILLIKDNGKRKFVYKYPGIQLDYCGRNALLILNAPDKKKLNIRLCMGNNARFIMEKTPYDVKLITHLGNNCSLLIGENFGSAETSIQSFGMENLFFKIGKNCMFSWDVSIWGSDGHTLFDKKTKKVMNKSIAEIHIGDHVWLGHGVHILKGCSIADNCVVGTHGLVTKSFLQPNCLIIGQPAKIFRKNIDWDRKDIFEFEKETQSD